MCRLLKGTLPTFRTFPAVRPASTLSHLAVAHEHDVIVDLIGLRGGLQQRHNDVDLRGWGGREHKWGLERGRGKNDGYKGARGGGLGSLIDDHMYALIEGG